MYDTAERVFRAKHAAKRLARRFERRALGRLAALCTLPTAALLLTLAVLTGPGQGRVQGAWGAALLINGAGGYVLTAVAAFAAASALTVACARLRGRKNERNREDERI